MDDARKEGKSAPFVCFCLVISYPAMRGDAMRTPNTHEPAFLFLSCLLNEIMGLHKNLSGSCAAILYVVCPWLAPGCWAFSDLLMGSALLRLLYPETSHIAAAGSSVQSVKSADSASVFQSDTVTCGRESREPTALQSSICSCRKCTFSMPSRVVDRWIDTVYFD